MASPTIKQLQDGILDRLRTPGQVAIVPSGNIEPFVGDIAKAILSGEYTTTTFPLIGVGLVGQTPVNKSIQKGCVYKVTSLFDIVIGVTADRGLPKGARDPLDGVYAISDAVKESLLGYSPSIAGADYYEWSAGLNNIFVDETMAVYSLQVNIKHSWNPS